MKYPDVIKKGTRIRIGSRPLLSHFANSAIGIEFILPSDVSHVEDGLYRHVYLVDVLADPNHCGYDEISHGVNLKYDKILGAINKDLKTALNRIED